VGGDELLRLHPEDLVHLTRRSIGRRSALVAALAEAAEELDHLLLYPAPALCARALAAATGECPDDPVR
jgi:hypothetical protein